MPKKKVLPPPHRDLICVPHFDFDQPGDLKKKDEEEDDDGVSLKICFYDNGVHIVSAEPGVAPIITYRRAKELFREILHQIPKAQAALTIVMMLFCFACTKPDIVQPVSDWQYVTIKKHESGDLYRIWRERPLDIQYKNYWWDYWIILDRWCIDSTGMETRIIGIGELCIGTDCITLE